MAAKDFQSSVEPKSTINELAVATLNCSVDHNTKI